jgi:hypothetical protein
MGGMNKFKARDLLSPPTFIFPARGEEVFDTKTKATPNGDF